MIENKIIAYKQEIQNKRGEIECIKRELKITGILIDDLEAMIDYDNKKKVKESG